MNTIPLFMHVFSQEEIVQHLLEVSDSWSYTGVHLVYIQVFKDFKTAILFLNKIAVLAESHRHHPQIINTYNSIELRLRTNDFNGITALDFQMAKAIDKLE